MCSEELGGTQPALGINIEQRAAGHVALSLLKFGLLSSGPDNTIRTGCAKAAVRQGHAAIEITATLQVTLYVILQLNLEKGQDQLVNLCPPILRWRCAKWQQVPL